MSGENSALTWLPVLGGLALKSLFVFLIAGAALLALRRASASARHLVCLLTLAGLLALPVLSLALPGWRLAVLATPSAPSASAAPALATLPVLAPVETGAPTKVVPFAPPSAHLAPLLALPTPVPTPRPFPWLIALFSLWLGGVLLAGLRPLLGLWGIARLSQTSAAVLDAHTLALIAECASALGLSRTPALYQAGAPVPMTWGWRHPVVLLPADAGEWPEERLRVVLLHELAHIQRRDWLSHRFADFVCALYWFHPLVWLIARRLRAEGEIACDDLVLTSGVAAPDYARHLLDVARALRPAPAVPQTAIAMARTARIEGRLRMILDTTRPRRALTNRALLLALGLSAAALVPLAVLHPGARAQAAPVLASLPAAGGAANSTFVNLINRGGHPPLVLHAAQFSMRTGRPGERPTFISSADLTINDTKLLAGATDADKPGSPWWSASGALLPTPVYDTAAYRAENHTETGIHNVFFALRLPPALQDVTVQYDLPQSVSFSSDGFWPTKTRDNARQIEARLFAKTNGARVLTAAYPIFLKKATVRVGIAAGSWKTAATDTHDTLAEAAGYTSDSPHGSRRFIFSRPIDISSVEAKSNVVLTISTDATDDLRVVAVTTQGGTVLPDQIGGSSIGTMDQITTHFGLPLAQIKEIRVETRPFQWVEFKDVALHPSGTPVASTEGPDPETLRLQQIYSFLQAYRRTHGGTFPPTSGPNNLSADMAAHPQAYGLPDQGAGNSAQTLHFFTSLDSPFVVYFLHNKRPDGTLVGTAKQAGTRDIFAYTNLEVRNRPQGANGFYTVLWDDGTVGRIPAGKILAVPAYDVIGSAEATERAARQGQKQIAFPGQSGLPRI